MTVENPIVAGLPNDPRLVEIAQRIEDAYQESGNILRWSLLQSPPSVLDGAEVAFLGLNPGGDKCPKVPAFSPTVGSAWETEKWGGRDGPGTSTLQKQLRGLCHNLGVAPVDVLAGNLVPFRSPRWSDLKSPEFSVRFGEKLWGEILDRAQPGLVVSMGRSTLWPLCHILGAKVVEEVPVNWGKVTAVKAVFPGGSLVVLPHLSTFQIINRPASQEALRALFDGRWIGPTHL